MNVRSNQPPKTEDCSVEGQPVDLWVHGKERLSRSVSTAKREPQAGPASSLSNPASRESNASGQDVVMDESNTKSPGKGEGEEGLPESKSVARAEGSTWNEGDPDSPCRTNCESQAGKEAPPQGALPGYRESDWPIVASSKAQAPKRVKEPTSQRSPHRQPEP